MRAGTASRPSFGTDLTGTSGDAVLSAKASAAVQTSDQIAEMLAAYGVSHFFFVPVVLPETVKRMPGRGILPVMTHGEKAAAYMADGYARISRKVGVCGAQAIGSTNLAAGLRDAYMARTPVIALSGVPSARPPTATSTRTSRTTAPSSR